MSEGWSHFFPSGKSPGEGARPKRAVVLLRPASGEDRNRTQSMDPGGSGFAVRAKGPRIEGHGFLEPDGFRDSASFLSKHSIPCERSAFCHLVRGGSHRVKQGSLLLSVGSNLQCAGNPRRRRIRVRVFRTCGKPPLFRNGCRQPKALSGPASGSLSPNKVRVGAPARRLRLSRTCCSNGILQF